MRYFVSKEGKKGVTREKESGEHSSKGGRNWGRVDAWEVGEKEVRTGSKGGGNRERRGWEHGWKGWKLPEKGGEGGERQGSGNIQGEKGGKKGCDNLERRRWELRGKWV